VRTRGKAQSPPQLKSPPTMEIESKSARMAAEKVNEKKRRERKPKVTRMATRYSEKWAEVSLTIQKAENMDVKIEESEKSYQLETTEEKRDSKKPIKSLSPIKKGMKKRDPSLESERSYQLEPKEEKRNLQKPTKNLSSTKKKSQKRDPSPLIEEEPKQIEETNSKILKKKILKRSLKKTSTQKARKKTPKKRISRHLKDDESEEYSIQIRKEKVDQQRRMVTRSTERILPSKSVTASSSESEKSDNLFEIKKKSETKIPNKSKKFFLNRKKFFKVKMNGTRTAKES